MSFVNQQSQTESKKYFYKYEPQPEITAYEVAQLIPLLLEAARDATLTVYNVKNRILPAQMNTQIESLDPSLQQHFKKSE